MRLLLASAGTTGELAPFVALARELGARGHRVRLAYNPAFGDEIRAAGVEPVACGPRFGREDFLERPELFDAWVPYPVESLVASWRKLDLPRCARDVVAAAEEADAVVASTLVPFGPLAVQATGRPWVGVATVPYQLHPRAAHGEGGAGRAALLGLMREAWAAVGLPEDRAGEGLDPSPGSLLVASSPHFSRPPRVAPRMELTGFWFHDHPWWGGWRPDPALAAFVEREPPLVLTLSSQPLADPGAVLRTWAGAARRLGLPLLALSGWSALREEDLDADAARDRVMVAGACPHGWLFPRARAVVHHGGIGVTARALLAGCPALVQPYTGEQAFNAWRLRVLGAGAAAHPHRVDAASGARILERAVLSPAAVAAAREAGERLAAEGGVSRACEVLESWLAPAATGSAR